MTKEIVCVKQADNSTMSNTAIISTTFSTVLVTGLRPWVKTRYDTTSQVPSGATYCPLYLAQPSIRRRLGSFDERPSI